MKGQTRKTMRKTARKVDASTEQEAQVAFKNMFDKLVDDYRQEYLIARSPNAGTRAADGQSDPATRL